MQGLNICVLSITNYHPVQSINNAVSNMHCLLLQKRETKCMHVLIDVLYLQSVRTFSALNMCVLCTCMCVCMCVSDNVLTYIVSWNLIGQNLN